MKRERETREKKTHLKGCLRRVSGIRQFAGNSNYRSHCITYGLFDCHLIHWRAASKIEWTPKVMGSKLETNERLCRISMLFHSQYKKKKKRSSHRSCARRLQIARTFFISANARDRTKKKENYMKRLKTEK